MKLILSFLAILVSKFVLSDIMEICKIITVMPAMKIVQRVLNQLFALVVNQIALYLVFIKQNALKLVQHL
jgi:hypothetical protein